MLLSAPTRLARPRLVLLQASRIKQAWELPIVVLGETVQELDSFTVATLIRSTAKQFTDPTWPRSLGLIAMADEQQHHAPGQHYSGKETER